MKGLLMLLALALVQYVYADGTDTAAKQVNQEVYQVPKYPYNYRQYAPRYAYNNAHHRYGLAPTYDAYGAHDLGHSLHLTGGIYSPYGHEYDDLYSQVGAYKPHLYNNYKYYGNAASPHYATYPSNPYVSYY